MNGDRAPSAHAQLGALATANARFWPTVAPVMWRELDGWRQKASRIEDAALRELAEEKLREEAFNAEVAATLATLAPRRLRATATRAIVALEVLFDYLDGRSELAVTAGQPHATSERLFEAMTHAVDPASEPFVSTPEDPDGEYLESLSRHVREQVRSLPAYGQARAQAVRATRRSSEAQSRLHHASSEGWAQLYAWAQSAAEGSGLDWREYVGGAASSILAAHAQIACSARTDYSREAAGATDRAYLPIGALITLLDSVVDERADAARDESGYVQLFANPAETTRTGLSLVRRALAASAETPFAAHHAMTLTGVSAYYASHPEASDSKHANLIAAVRRELSPAIWPTLLVMRSWRAAKSLRTRTSRRQHEPGEPSEAAVVQSERA